MVAVHYLDAPIYRAHEACWWLLELPIQYAFLIRMASMLNKHPDGEEGALDLEQHKAGVDMLLQTWAATTAAASCCCNL